MLKRLIWLGILLCGVLIGGCRFGDVQNGQNTSCTLLIPRIQSEHDQDSDGVLDADDILVGARREATNQTRYLDEYCEDGYPPDNVGVCTDVIWRAFREAGYDLKAMVDQDIQENLEEYPGVETPDPNIDFRRVVNLKVFFKRHAQSLTLKIKPYVVSNLQEWQGGDLVIFSSPNHIGVVSDYRRKDGVPYLIHNGGPYAKEEDALLYWAKTISTITGHYRWEQE
jgi:uncharacterized protein YijF (DUF1287 family)